MTSLLRSALVALPLLVATTSSSASETERTALSTLPTLPTAKDRTEPPEHRGVPGLTLKEQTIGTRSWLELHAATSQGYCLANRDSSFSLGDSSVWSENDKSELWRLTEKEGAGTLERTRFTVVGSLKDAWVASKTSVPLRKVTSDKGVTVWGLRDESGDVVLLARGVKSGRERMPSDEENTLAFVSSFECSFGAARIGTKLAKVGAIAQLRGFLPPVGQGKEKVIPQFLVDGSFARLTRDPEPMLAVRVRLVE
jgi:hypothetical protein